MKLKKIISRKYWRPTNIPKRAKDSVICTLECGHKVRFKGSQEPKKKAACQFCKKISEQHTVDSSAGE